MTAARPVSLEEAELHYHTALALTAPAQPDIEDMDTSHLRINSAMAAATLQSDIAKEAVSRHSKGRRGFRKIHTVFVGGCKSFCFNVVP